MLENRRMRARGLLSALMIASVWIGCGGDSGADESSPSTDTSSDNVASGDTGSQGDTGSNSGPSPSAGDSAGMMSSNGGNTGSASGGSTGTSNGTGGGTNAPALSDADTMFRADTLKLLEPNIITKPLGIESAAITASVQSAVDNALVQDNEPDDGDGIAEDSDGDGYVDLNVIVRFLGKLDAGTKTGFATVGGALCPYPLDLTKACGPFAAGPFGEALGYETGTDCALDGTNKVAKGACFKTKKGPVTVNVQLIGQVPLQEGQVIGTFVNGGADGIASGFVRGFLSEEVAKSTKLPPKLPLAAAALGISGGTPLIDFLSNREKVKNGSTSGWWFLMTFSAKPAKYDRSVGPDTNE